jgi:hypothetical protein
MRPCRTCGSGHALWPNRCDAVGIVMILFGTPVGMGVSCGAFIWWVFG